MTERIKTLSNITSLPVILGPQVLPDGTVCFFNMRIILILNNLARSVSRTKRILNPSQLPFSSGSVIRLRPVGYSEDDDDGDYDGEDDRMISKPKIGRLYLRCQYTRQ